MTLDTQTTHSNDHQSMFAEAISGGYNPDTNASIEAADTPTEKQAEEAVILPTDKIHKREGHNPRRIRSKAKMADMRESIRTKGVIQPILVRPHPEIEGAYELVAGETRLMLSIEVGRSEIAALVKDLTDEEMLDYAATENTQRIDMSPVDEGLAAQSLLAQGKDKNEVCRVMGWTPAFFDGRIQLTHCCDDVSQALVDDKIALGHAQLLSGLRETSQKNALKAILEKNLTVEQLSKIIAGMALTLKAAAFDLTDCQTCPHNSNTQASLFADSQSLGKARCLNKECYDKKTQAHLDAVKSDLSESYHRVAFTGELAAGTTTVIVESGAYGVGEEQATACQSCEHFGATIDNTLGSRAAVTKNVCFNLPCHTNKVQERKNLIATDKAPASEEGETTGAADKATATDTTKADAATGSDKPASKATAKAASKPAKKPDVAKSAIPRKIVDLHHQVHRTAAAAHVYEDDKTALIISVLSMMADANVEPDSKPEGWPMNLTGENRGKAAAMLDTLSVEQLTTMQRRIAAKAMQKAKSSFGGENEKDAFGSVAVWVAKSREVDLSKHFTMDDEYLTPFTKPMATERLKASGFAEAYDKEHGEKAFTKLAAGKKGDLLTAVKDSGFDFSGYLPEGLKLND